MGIQRACALMAVCAWGLASCKPAPQPVQPQPSLSSNSPNSVATLTDLVSDVSLRKAAELVWNPATDKSPLANYDAVQTGASSSAQILFTDQSVVSLSERSMVVVLEGEKKQDVEETVIALYTGEVRTRLSPSSVSGAKPRAVVIKTRKGWVRAKAVAGAPQGLVQVSASISSDGALKVVNEGGDVTILAKDSKGPKEKPVLQNQQVIIGQGWGQGQGQGPEAAPPKVAPSVSPSPAQTVPDEFRDLPDVPERDWEPVPPQAQKKERSFFEILKPKRKTVIVSDRVLISGKMSKDVRAYYKGDPVKADRHGKFYLQISLNPGLNVLTFQVVGSRGVRYETVEVIRR